jgi:glycosyltransferase involved in cell wall biosynthesis
MIDGYIRKEERRKILLLGDDLRMTSGISTMSKEFVLGTAHQLNWVQIGGAINHPEQGRRLDLTQDTNKMVGIEDSSVILYPTAGYGTQELVRQIIDIEKPDAIMIFTDPRYWIWLFAMEREIRTKIPIVYLNIWDDLPAPLYNKPYYESCDGLLAISKQTENINKMVLGQVAKDKVIKYVPHGINEKIFFPVTEFMADKYAAVQEMKKKIFGKNIPEFVVFYNARNIRRKSTSDLIVAYAQFCDLIGKEKAKKCALLLHTQPIDDNGTDLPAVVNLTCDPTYQRVIINDDVLPAEDLNLMYNIGDVTALISSNEGWGLSLTEAMMAGRMIIGNVTGGMQDQMRFEDENGKWIEFNEEFCSNHFGKYKKHGKWAMPIFPSNSSLVGSPMTPYIWDDRCDPREVAKAIQEVYELDPVERSERGMSGRAWATSKEAMMTANNMSKNIFDGIHETLNKFTPRKQFELIKADVLPVKKSVHPIYY